MEEVKVVTDELELDVNLFSKLYNLDVSVYKEQLKTERATLDYLSWAQAYQLLIHQDPKAKIVVCVVKVNITWLRHKLQPLVRQKFVGCQLWTVNIMQYKMLLIKLTIRNLVLLFQR